MQGVPELSHRFMPIGGVVAETHLSPPTIYRKIAKGQFPRPVKFGQKSLWIRDEVEGWLTARIAARDEVAA